MVCCRFVVALSIIWAEAGAGELALCPYVCKPVYERIYICDCVRACVCVWIRIFAYAEHNCKKGRSLSVCVCVWLAAPVCVCLQVQQKLYCDRHRVALCFICGENSVFGGCLLYTGLFLYQKKTKRNCKELGFCFSFPMKNTATLWVVFWQHLGHFVLFTYRYIAIAKIAATIYEHWTTLADGELKLLWWTWSLLRKNVDAKSI